LKKKILRKNGERERGRKTKRDDVTRRKMKKKNKEQKFSRS